MHLEIKQSTNSREDVANSVVEKLYDLLYENSSSGITRQLDDSSYIEGYINVQAAYQNKIEYLTTRRQTPYVYLNIDAASAYIPFKDSYVEQKLVNAGYGDGTGITVTAAGQITSTQLKSLVQNDGSITSFDELKYFTSIHEIISDSFQNCTSITSIVLPTSCIKVKTNVFQNCTALSSINVENIEEMGHGAFAYCNNIAHPFYFKNLVNQYDRFYDNGLFTGGSQYIYAPKIPTISGGFDSGSNNVAGLFVKKGWGNSRCSKYIVYFKDLSSLMTGAFCGGSVLNLVINNVTPPTVSLYEDANGNQLARQNLLIDVNGTSTNSFIQNLWVPRAAISLYTADTYWSELSGRIHAIEDMAKVATREQWDLLSDQDKQSTLIEEYMN